MSSPTIVSLSYVVLGVQALTVLVLLAGAAHAVLQIARYEGARAAAARSAKASKAPTVPARDVPLNATGKQLRMMSALEFLDTGNDPVDL
jgi:hypothetical protein